MTPEQMRALAGVLSIQRNASRTQADADAIAALRAAADQLETLSIERDALRAQRDELAQRILTADTAPQAHHPACGALDEPCHCAERGDAPQEDRDE